MLSVITPAFNAERFLLETLDSVASLTIPHEHVVVDDGSTDGTAEMLRTRRDPRLVWKSQRNRGQAGAVNTGLELSQGDLLAWLNADDTYVAENVDMAVSLLRADASIDAVFGFMDVVDKDGRVIKHHRCGPFLWTRYLYFGGYLPTPTIILRRSLLSRAPRLNERYEHASDYDFYLRLLRGAKVRRVRRPLVRFRYHPTSKTAASGSQMRQEGLEIQQRYARNHAERRLMVATNWATELRNSIFPPWPGLQSQG